MELKQNGKAYQVAKILERPHDCDFNQWELNLNRIGDIYKECTDGWYVNMRSGCRVDIQAIKNAHLFFVELWPINDKKELTIICAAVRTGNGAILGGYRHGTIRQNIKALNAEIWGDKKEARLCMLNAEDGFIGSDGQFYDRVEAYKIALAAGQIADNDGVEKLVSEDLY